MEKKTIGSFIAALRKANGMTQKDLADRLNVSDKTVSRWERDDGSPDLSMIPVIAEIFGVTCDELLRGERKSPEERAESTEENESTPRGEKQRQRMLKSSLLQYRTYSWVAMGISTVGLIAALVCNLAFLRAVLGFWIGAVFFVIGIIFQIIALNRTFFSVEDSDVDETELSAFKLKVIRLAQKSVGLVIAYIGFTFPLVWSDAYVGLSAGSMIKFGAAGAAFFLLVYVVICYFLNEFLLKKGTYKLSERESAIYNHNHKLKGICAVVLEVLLILTACVHCALTGAVWAVMEGTVFNDYESFVKFMEQDIPSQPSDGMVNTYHVYYDENGNEISMDDDNRCTLEDGAGNIVCEYIDRNKSVIGTSYSEKDETLLPITVYTQDDLKKAKEIIRTRHVIFALVYAFELAAVLVFYSRKRMK